jgi:hypothetical protein
MAGVWIELLCWTAIADALTLVCTAPLRVRDYLVAHESTTSKRDRPRGAPARVEWCAASHAARCLMLAHAGTGRRRAQLVLTTVALASVAAIHGGAQVREPQGAHCGWRAEVGAGRSANRPKWEQCTSRMVSMGTRLADRHWPE